KYTACTTVAQCFFHRLQDSSEGSISSMKDQLYGNSTCKKRNCQKESLYRGYVQQYTESRWETSKVHQNDQIDDIKRYASSCSKARDSYCVKYAPLLSISLDHVVSDKL
ncbi:hypothetical protein EMCRGX_G033390, partial [Ephydatia muelleri]